MITFNIMLATIHICICLMGLFGCLYLLCTKKVNTEEAHNTIPLCFFGMSWAIFLYAAINSFDNPHLFHVIGVFLFLLGIMIWVKKKFNRAFHMEDARS